MNLEARSYTPLYYIKIPLKVAPLHTLAILLLLTAAALAPSLLIAVTADFVNTALAVVGSAAGAGGGTPGVSAAASVAMKDGFTAIAGPLALLALTLLSSRLASLLLNALKLRLGRRMREAVDPRILRKRGSLSYPHIENDETWDLIARVGKNPSERLSGAFYNLLDAAEYVVRIGGVLAVLSAQAWWIGALTLAAAVPLTKLAFSLGREDYLAYAAAQTPARRADYLRDVLSSRADLEERTLFRYGEEVGRRWSAAFEEARLIVRHALRRNFIRTKSAAILTSLLGLIVSLLLLLPLTRGSLSAGMYIGLATAVWNLSEQMSWRLSQVFQQVAQNRAFLADWTAFMALDEVPGAELTPDFAAQEEPLGAIVFDRVGFAYPGSAHPVLDNLCLTLEPGKRYAIVGRNGAGKSTLVKLLTGLYTDYTGSIVVGGRDLRQWPAEELKAAFAVTFQDYANYEVPLRAQVALGSRHFGTDTDSASIKHNCHLPGGASSDPVRKALEQVGLGGLADTLPLGTETPLGRLETGAADLSGGQWQRVALARNALSGAPVHILDEPTAALDPVGEHRLYELFGAIGKESGATVIQITHRLGAAVSADEILVLDGGAVAETGSHAELLLAGGLYAEMYESQRSWYAEERTGQDESQTRIDSGTMEGTG
ncbi:ABC transporter ATP-binding protein [Saccharibacillus sp. CPCC 101409]|uniref:ATP-binding cassette domain-containing protein n=1 Tax=Saccharibacillus sp. CPCC 101409 TaxID=3058041 RepID=UPI002671A154|nr:ABC transporter ATP-binding protein [Saccharibacillus sp. CPCC 101409]MDO3408289.1 ABC transporter ATP-binding protein [Saccharibacillus sp. CPCC 101409]